MLLLVVCWWWGGGEICSLGWLMLCVVACGGCLRCVGGAGWVGICSLTCVFGSLHVCSLCIWVENRVIYFDRIRVDKVEGIVHDIYKYVLDLEDIQFLIRYAPKLFPETSEEVTGELIANNVIDLQTQLAKERAEAIKNVETAMKGVYPQVDPPRLAVLCEETTVLFRRVVDLKKLAADAQTFFPTEFDSAEPKEIRRAFLIAKREAEEEDA